MATTKLTWQLTHFFHTISPISVEVERTNAVGGLLLDDNPYEEDSVEEKGNHNERKSLGQS